VWFWAFRNGKEQDNTEHPVFQEVVMLFSDHGRLPVPQKIAIRYCTLSWRVFIRWRVTGCFKDLDRFEISCSAR